MFAMCDALEQDDQVWGQDEDLPDGHDWRRYIYPSSLLYLVSGILESRQNSAGEWEDEPDMPLVGMQRYLTNSDTYSEAGFPGVNAVRSWLTADPKRTVWSRTASNPEGFNCQSIDHGAFDTDPATLSSLQEIVVRGF